MNEADRTVSVRMCEELFYGREFSGETIACRKGRHLDEKELLHTEIAKRGEGWMSSYDHWTKTLAK